MLSVIFEWSHLRQIGHKLEDSLDLVNPMLENVDVRLSTQLLPDDVLGLLGDVDLKEGHTLSSSFSSLSPSSLHNLPDTSILREAQS